jgi:hypothetical protein
MTAWKDLERRICRALGGQRAGPIGAAVSDCVGVPFAVEVKRCTRVQLRGSWLVQARAQAEREGNPWLLVVGEHNTRRPVAVLDFYVLAEICQQAGLIPTPLVIEETEE